MISTLNIELFVFLVFRFLFLNSFFVFFLLVSITPVSQSVVILCLFSLQNIFYIVQIRISFINWVWVLAFNRLNLFLLTLTLQNILIIIQKFFILKISTFLFFILLVIDNLTFSYYFSSHFLHFRFLDH
jgi:hypothetical protein